MSRLPTRMQISTYNPPLRSLRGRWVAIVLASCGAILLGYTALAANWSGKNAGQWLIVSAALSALVLINVRQNLARNHPPGRQELFTGFGPATLLTISRGILVAMLAGFLLQPWPAGWLRWVPGVLYWISNLTDLFDGYIARRTNQITALGEYLDMQFDGLAVLVGALLTVQYGQLPALFVLAGIARYLFIIGERYRRSRGKPVHDLPPSVRRRAVAGVFMCMVGTMLLPIFTPPGTHLAGYGFLAVFIGGFTLDWLVASGRLDAAGANRTSTRLERLSAGVAVLLRLVLIAVMGFGLWIMLAQPSEPTSLFWPLLMAQIPLLLAYLLGIAGRVTALLHLILLGFAQNLTPLNGAELVAVIAATLLFFTGTGPASLWTPEDRLLFGRTGKATQT